MRRGNNLRMCEVSGKMEVAAQRDKVRELQRDLAQLGKRLCAGDRSQLIVWVIPGALACAHRPLRYHPKFGGSGRKLPAEALDELINWIDWVRAERIVSILALISVKELKHYDQLDIKVDDLIAYYRQCKFNVVHIPWEDPRHRDVCEEGFAKELARVCSESLKAFDELPKPILLHCSAGIDRSSPVAGYLFQTRSRSRSVNAPSP